MGPFGSDTRRYDMHCMCHSTSICHSWGPLLNFRPLSFIIFMKMETKVIPILKTLKHKNVRVTSHRASQKLSRRSFGSKLNFVVLILYFYMDFHGFPWISMDLNTKKAEYRATRHEIKNFLYETIDLFKSRRLKYARESETPK